MIDNTQNNNIESSYEESKKVANIENTQNSLRVEPLHNANHQVTDSLVHRMISSQEDKVDPEVSITKEGNVDLKEGPNS